MQSSHLCYPSSSTTTDYASRHISSYVLSILHSAGFSNSSSQAVDLLTEVFERYLLLLGSTSKHHTNHVGRRLATPWDIELSLGDLGTSTEDIRVWFDEEGGDVAGRWMNEDDLKAGIASETNGLGSAKQLLERQNATKVSVSEDGKLFLYYENIDESRCVELGELLLADEKAAKAGEEEEEEEGEDPVISNHGRENGVTHSNGILPVSSPPPPYRTIENQGSPPTEPPRYKKRRLSTQYIEYVPDFLPRLPNDDDDQTLTTDAQENDAEYLRERGKLMQMGEEQKSLLNTVPIGETGREEKEAEVMATPELAPEVKRSAEDNWHSAIDFASSQLAQQQSVDDLPTTNSEEEQDVSNYIEKASNQSIFANDYSALVTETETNSVAPSLLTPMGGLYVGAFNQRRYLASLISDPTKYVPCDTVFGSIDARPSATPFNPGPSLLITPPTSTNPAPTFTPIFPFGRELISTNTINNSLFPACKHRKPSNILNASRMLAAGEVNEMFRRITRIQDPIPILDERHAERVFHGIQVPKELLHDENSYLRQALDVLRLKREEEINVADVESTEIQQSQFNLGANREKLRVKSGTLVQTWDWMPRDYTDAVLPGKKYRSGTIGVKISGNAINENDAVDPREGLSRSDSILLNQG